MSGTSTFTGTVSSDTRLPLTLAGNGPYSRLVELHLVVLHDHRAAALDVIEQAAIVGAQIARRLVGADAGDDHVVLRQIAPRQFVLIDERDLRAQLLDGGGT